MSNDWYKNHEQPASPVGLLRLMPRLRLLALAILAILCPLLGQAQTNRAVSGKVTDANSTGLPGVTVLVPGTTVGTSTGADGAFTLQVPETATALSFSFVGYATQQVDITGKTSVQVALKEDAQGLSEVVVVGYGTARKQDVTGAVAVIGEKDFNKGTFTSPDQLIQGRVSGVQVSNNSGQPGGPATIRIRGNSAVTGTGQPLYVVDGVPLDGRTARPGLVASGDVGTGADSNPLNFLNPDDVESLTVLKDASATAIYGSRAAYGVVLITTKKGKAGAPVLNVGVSNGFSTLLRRPAFLNASQYRQAITYYGAPATNDKGGDVDALKEILRTGRLQNYNVAMSGGGETGRYRLSLGYLDQDGIVRKSGFKKYSANLSTNLQFLESKKLGVDVNIATSQFREELPPITTDAGFRGSLIGQALQWNPTQPLRNADGSLFIQSGDVVNPLAAQELFNDNSRVNTVLASIAPSYKFTDWLQYRMLLSVNYNSGERRTSIDQRLINYPGIEKQGFAAISNNELVTQQIAHTLNFNKALTSSLNLNAVLGYEYTKFSNSGSNVNAYGNADAGGFGNFGLDYTNYIQYSSSVNRQVSSFVDPSSQLQSVFGRAILNFKDRYVLTGTLRRDESSKFGPNERVGYFPSFAAAWDLGQEAFFPAEKLSQLKLRAGYGRTGNQEFPAGAAQYRFSLDNNGAQAPINGPNPNLKWQADAQYNVGIDIGAFNNRLTFTADYFNKTTTDLLFPSLPGQPAPPVQAIYWVNLDGKIVNKGVEMALGATLVTNEKVEIGLNANATFVRNEVSGLTGASIPTGAINGQGLSGALSQSIQNGYPINAFFLPQYNGLSEKGLSNTFGAIGYAGSPNPRTLLGLAANARYGKLSLVANMTGVFGQYIYNNTLNAVGNVGQIGAGKNIALSTFENPIKEALGNASAATTRYLEKGDYLKLSNLTLAYSFGNVGTFMKGARIYATGQNLFVITNYSGFDPEINTVKRGANQVPSVGIDYLPYPSARTFTFGVNFSL
ncbi:SusC/RagA family TonB-linked outer membrane protein [Hymenobacter sp. BT770]|uniref:SusC/RagA family TonB-linked outer membrane protein n=1 Tax=Hymenobacter sp. BT770 TaxID=2886942 RepID=UPI001D1297EB|nr:SusC/RagA family TonB-linked outer membrane protein [Hymenobacter sp. BT770]MCC3153616.1 SusC/RagA family TonB-linked outer membrane protein [Hymenobacter sp. BT770]MDO3415918.1 SusC/RagA family TonB-linked outer membrane protein [Hymenobacter sp. BT770]